MAQAEARRLTLTDDSIEPVRVLIAVDASPSTEHTLAQASRLFDAAQRRVMVVSVLPPGERTPARSEITRLVERHLADLDELEFLQSQDVVGAIERAASAWRADAIVLGTSGGGGEHGAPVGATARALLARTHIPVLLVPSP